MDGVSSFERQNAVVAVGSVAAALTPYLEAARNGTTAGLRACFHDDARIAGWVDGQFLVLHPDAFVSWVANNGPSPEISSRIASIDVSGSAAAVRIEFNNWLGFRFTDFFVLNREEGGWRVTSKVFDSHDRNATAGTVTAPEGDAESFAEVATIAGVVDTYTESARWGDRARLRSIWYDHARIIGWFDGAPINRDVGAFCARVADGGGAPNLRAQVVSIDRSGVAASARIELSDWNGIRYTDFFTLLKGPDGWQVSGKVFDAHSRR